MGRRLIGFHLELPNYRNLWLRLGFTEADFAHGGSDRLVDAMLAWGDENALRARVQAHLDAGADHVPIFPVDPADPSRLCWRALEALADRSRRRSDPGGETRRRRAALARGPEQAG